MSLSGLSLVCLLSVSPSLPPCLYVPLCLVLLLSLCLSLSLSVSLCLCLCLCLSLSPSLSLSFSRSLSARALSPSAPPPPPATACAPCNEVLKGLYFTPPCFVMLICRDCHKAHVRQLLIMVVCPVFEMAIRSIKALDSAVTHGQHYTNRHGHVVLCDGIPNLLRHCIFKRPSTHKTHSCALMRTDKPTCFADKDIAASN